MPAGHTPQRDQCLFAGRSHAAIPLPWCRAAATEFTVATLGPLPPTAGTGGHVTPVICVAAYLAESFRSRCQQPSDGVQWNPYIRSFAMVPSGGFTSW